MSILSFLKKVFFQEIRVWVSADEFSFTTEEKQFNCKTIITVEKDKNLIMAVGNEVESEMYKNTENIYFLNSNIKIDEYYRFECLVAYIIYCIKIMKGKKITIFKPIVIIENIESLKECLNGKEKKVVKKAFKIVATRVKIL